MTVGGSAREAIQTQWHCYRLHARQHGADGELAEQQRISRGSCAHIGVVIQ